MNGIWEYFIRDRKCGRGMQKLWGERMAEFLKDERLVKGYDEMGSWL